MISSLAARMPKSLAIAPPISEVKLSMVCAMNDARSALITGASPLSVRVTVMLSPRLSGRSRRTRVMPCGSLETLHSRGCSQLPSTSCTASEPSLRLAPYASAYV